MQTYDVVVECEPSTSIRARQVCGMFDVSPNEKCRLQWSVDLPTDETDWNVGLIVGPSGSGKSTIARRSRRTIEANESRMIHAGSAKS